MSLSTHLITSNCEMAGGVRCVVLTRDLTLTAYLKRSTSDKRRMCSASPGNDTTQETHTGGPKATRCVEKTRRAHRTALVSQAHLPCYNGTKREGRQQQQKKEKCESSSHTFITTRTNRTELFQTVLITKIPFLYFF